MQAEESGAVKSIDPLVLNDPEVEEFDEQEWKLLFMLLAENRGGINFHVGLTPYGVGVLSEVQRKLGVRVVGVDLAHGEVPESALCYCCLQPVVYAAGDTK